MMSLPLGRHNVVALMVFLAKPPLPSFRGRLRTVGRKMNATKLLKLLTDMDNRIARIQKDLGVGVEESRISNDLVVQLSDMRSSIQRLHGKVDTFSLVDVERLELGIARLQELSPRS